MFNYLKANLFNDLFMSLKKILNLAFLLLKYFSDGIFRVLQGRARATSPAREWGRVFSFSHERIGTRNT
jgi:hypothetical protein